MFHTKVVEEIKTRMLCSAAFSFSRIVLFMRKCGKILYSIAGTYNNMAYALFLLDT